MAELRLKNVEKVYKGGFNALKNINLEINDREFVVFVGPSGCGKSTLLRMIAGLEKITGGEIIIDGKVVNDIDPKDRDVAMVFQNYALYPHMSVYDNMAFSLNIKKEDKKVIEEKVSNAAEILGLTSMLKRKPGQLSGGQRQRVALGRAIVRNPKVFLMDEPLSNLDAKLRLHMRTEISKLHNSLDSTTIYVTHDQTEAMTMGDKIVVLNGGVIQQIGSPDDVYDWPANLFVAEFIGSPSINIIERDIVDGQVDFFGQKVGQNVIGDYDKEKVLVGLRPENIRIVDGSDFVVSLVENLGSEKYVHLEKNISRKTFNIDGDERKNIIVKVHNSLNFKRGQEVGIEVSNTEILNFFDPDNGETLNEIK